MYLSLNHNVCSVHSYKARQNDTQLQVADSSVMVPGTVKSPEKEDLIVPKGQNQQANSDANKPTDLSLQKPQQSTKSVNPDVSSKQQGSEPSNLSASQKSKVSGMTSESAQPESHHGSTDDKLGMCTKDVIVLCPMSV